MTQTGYDIPAISSRVAPIARDYGVAKLSLFGSHTRGDATVDSTIDFRIIDKGELRGLFRRTAFRAALRVRNG
jgi:predicted nucleotidyltransferase